MFTSKTSFSLLLATVALICWTWPTAASATVCNTKVTLTLNLMEIGGNPLPGLKYDLYEQEEDNLKRQVAGTRVAGGAVDARGEAEIKIAPDPDKKYALRVYQLKADIGEYWFFDAVQFSCGNDKTLNRSLPYLKVVLRDSAGNLKKNQGFSLYEQTYDFDNRPVKDPKRLIANLKTGEDGTALVFVGTAHPYDLNKRGLYVISTSVDKTIFDVYDIAMLPFRNYVLEYTFSSLAVNLRSAAGQPLVGQEVSIYQQMKSGNNLSLDTRVRNGKTDSSGYLRLEYPAGTYAVAVKDSFNRDAVIWNVTIKEQQANKLDFVLNSMRASLADGAGELLANTGLRLFSLYENNGKYYKDKEIGVVKIGANKLGVVSLSEGPYLLSYAGKDKIEYGQAFWALAGQTNTVLVKMQQAQQISATQSFSPAKPASGATATSVNVAALANRLAGRILLQTESAGEAWYVNPKDLKRYYLVNGSAAFKLMRSAGIGATNADLQKIPIGVGSRFAGDDSDGDLLPDGLEIAIGTNPNNPDSDQDGFKDGAEIAADFDPLSIGRLRYDLAFANKQKGKILLQVQKNGEAWYVNPQDGKRYYLGNGDSAFQIMRFLSLGISNKDLAGIGVGQ